MKFNVNDIYNQVDEILADNDIHVSDFPRIELAQCFYLSDFDGLNYYITDFFGYDIDFKDISKHEFLIICVPYLDWELQYHCNVKTFGNYTSEIELLLNDVELI